MKLNAFKPVIPEVWLPKKIFLVMKLTTLIMIIALMQCSARGYSQKINLNVTNAPLKKVLQLIKKQTSYVFFYDSKDVLHKNVTIDVKDASLEETLTKCFNKFPLTYRIVNNTVFLKEDFLPEKNNGALKNGSEIAVATIPITGLVTDEKNQPLPGATVKLKGGTIITTTDKAGKFKINVPDNNSILVFSFIGYLTKELLVSPGSEMTVNLVPDQSKLNEVIVVGYGTQKKSELTNAVVQTTGKELTKSNEMSLSNSLSGRLAGLYVTQSSSGPGFDDAQILVRGYNTYRNSSALIVIDGVANADPDGLNRLDPHDIESISVLKDASAAIYGAQSAGGVILVTTKRGKSGKPSFTFSTNFSNQTPTVKVKSASALEYMKVLNNRRTLEGTPPDFPDTIVADFTSGKRRGENWWGALIGGPPATQSKHSLTMSGGSEKVKYFTSIGLGSQGGILRGDNTTKLKQYNVRNNLDVSVTNNFDVGVDLALREKYTQSPEFGPGGQVGYFANTSPLVDAYIDGNYNYPSEGWEQLNPAARLLSPGYVRNTTDVASGTFRFKYNMPFVKGLVLDGFASLDKTYNYNKNFNYLFFFYQKDATGAIQKMISRGADATALSEYFSRSLRTTENLKLSYNTVINNDHKINAFVSYEQSVYNDNYFTTQRTGYNSGAIDQLFAGSPNPQNWTNDGSASESARQNYFGRVNYAFQNKYLLGFSARYDGSVIFPPGHRFGFFPQASAAWVVSEESFMPKDLFSNLKIRASWGRLGNDRVNPFQYIGAFGYSQGYVINGLDVRGVTATSTPNPNITWEVSEKTDIGFEVGLLQNRLTFEADIYKSATSHILGQRQASIPGYTGLVLPDENIGKMDSHGIEFQAGYRQSIGKVNLNVSGNVSFNANKIIYFDETPQSEPYQKLEGNPIGSILVYKAIGIYRTTADLAKYPGYPGATIGGLIFADLNHDAKIDGNDMYRYNASVFPKMQYGLNIGLDYKSFDLSILLQGQSGAKFRLSNGFNSGAGGNGLEYVANNSYSLSNPNSVLPRIEPVGTEGADADFYYHSSTWLRLKALEMGYTLPQNLVSRLKISSLRFFVSGNNLFLLYNNLKKYGAGDPEFLYGNGGGYPNMRTLNAGLNLTF
jgi:TonB-linked SusC/RagA family outer membrane protein